MLPLQPFCLTIFGINGHLSRSKLVPAISELNRTDELPDHFSIIGFGRRPLTRAAFETLLTEFISHPSVPSVQTFLQHCHYFEGRFEKSESFTKLKSTLIQLEQGANQPLHHLYYLATAPSYFEMISQQLHQAGLTKPAADGVAPLLLIEKPFGHDLASAKTLETALLRTFREEQLYRIDHYLGKHQVQELRYFQSNDWDRSTIDHIQILLAESDGIGTRGDYYDVTGALRDIVQNHALQMLALVTMDNPKALAVDEFRQQRAAAIQACVIDTVITGQYAGYLSEDKVKEGSRTETFTAIKAHLTSKRWEDVPVYILTGKRLKEKVTSVTVVFKDGTSTRHTISSYPNESDAHEHLFLDALRGDQTFFVHAHEIKAQWEVIDAISNHLPPPLRYEPGSWGPQHAIELMQKDGRTWFF